MLLVPTVVPFLSGMKTSVDQVGWFMSPAPGGVTLGSGRMSHSGWPMADAAASPCRCSVTVLLNASLRLTREVRPVLRELVGGRQRERRRRRDGEVGDLHDGAVVDRQQEPIADGEDVVEVADHLGAVVAQEGGDLAVRAGRVGGRRQRRSGIAGQQVGALLVLEGLLGDAGGRRRCSRRGRWSTRSCGRQAPRSLGTTPRSPLWRRDRTARTRGRARSRWPECARRSRLGWWCRQSRWCWWRRWLGSR